MTADAETKGQDEAVRFTINEGKTVITTIRDTFFGGDGERVDAFPKKFSEDRVWTLQLATHPQYAPIQLLFTLAGCASDM